MTLLRSLAVIAAFLLPALHSAKATTISVTDANFGGATADMSATVTISGTATATIFEITGVDIDGDGSTTDDDLNVAINVTSENNGAITFDGGNNRYQPNINAVDDDIILTLGSVTPVGTDPGGVSIDSFAFTEIRLAQFQSSSESFNLTINDGLATEQTVGPIANNGNNQPLLDPDPAAPGDLFDGITNVADTSVTITNVDGSFRLQDFHFEVEASAAGGGNIPEPATLALFGLGSLGLVTRRRK